MPGSPPTSTIEPGTTPPPSTRANSPIGSGRRSSTSPCDLGQARGVERPQAAPGAAPRRRAPRRRSLPRPCCSRRRTAGSAPSAGRWCARTAGKHIGCVSLASWPVSSEKERDVSDALSSLSLPLLEGVAAALSDTPRNHFVTCPVVIRLRPALRGGRLVFWLAAGRPRRRPHPPGWYRRPRTRPSSSASESGSSTFCWITRRSGRAPISGS